MHQSVHQRDNPTPCSHLTSLFHHNKQLTFLRCSEFAYIASCPLRSNIENAVNGFVLKELLEPVCRSGDGDECHIMLFTGYGRMGSVHYHPAPAITWILCVVMGSLDGEIHLGLWQQSPHEILRGPQLVGRWRPSATYAGHDCCHRALCLPNWCVCRVEYEPQINFKVF
ncbi:hypothetical protein BJY04DRAFT_202923 [Aspergillus karnatakaensis]|uniref:uncharacterized protein n=1 Tax=Aspergillus karnatakaensis TaxID=1810916 RepID=UPI003CCD8C90